VRSDAPDPRADREADLDGIVECGLSVESAEGRIASPEMFPSIELLPHLKCSRPGWDRRGSDEAGEHGDA